MPFKSEAQRRKFGALVKEGKMSQDTFNKWQSETPKGKLPERINTKPKKPKRPTSLPFGSIKKKP